MIRSLSLGIWLACLALCQSVSAFSLLPAAPEIYALADSIPPVISCPANITVQQDPGLCTKVVEYQVTATDDQPGVLLARTAGLASGSAFPLGITVNSFIAVDVAGNNVTCSFTVNIVGTNPTPACKDMTTVYLEANCSHTVSSMEVLSGNNCPTNYPVELDRTPPFGNGPWEAAIVTGADLNKTYQVRVTNSSSGNRCWGNITVKDTIKPQLFCPTVKVLCMVTNFTPTYLADSLGISAGRPTFTDNCSSTLTSAYLDTQTNLPCDSVIHSKLISRRWTVTDASGNTSTCIQTINSQRIRADDVIFPTDKVLSCSAPDLSVATNGVPFIAFGGREWPVNPGLCELAASFTDSTTSQCGGSTLIRRHWQIINFCAATIKKSVQNLDIQDVLAPIITCPPATNVRVNANNCQGKVKLPDAVIQDGCSAISEFSAEWTIGGGGQAFGHLSDWPGNDPLVRDTLGSIDSLSFPTGPITITYIAADLCGNTGTCSFTLFVSDTIAPTPVCKPFLTVQLANDGSFSLPVDSLNAGSNDGCGAVFFKVRRELSNSCQTNDHLYDAASFCCTDIGDTVTLRLRVYDAPPPTGTITLQLDIAHTSECTTRVLVTDLQPLYCLAPPDVSVTCDSFDASLATYGNIIARSCQADSLEILIDSTQFINICHQGQIIRTFRVWDAAGDSTDCVQRITVAGFQDYYVRFPDDIIVTKCVSSDYGAPQIYGLGCESIQITQEDQIHTVVQDACYKIERTWQIFNYCQYNPSQPLTTVPNPNPTILNSAANLLGPTISPMGTTGDWAPTITRVNPSDPAQTNYGTFWSATSNGYKYTQIIKVIDGVAPVFDNCPAAVPFFVDTTMNNAELWNASYWFDPATTLHDLADFPTPLTITATDSCSGSDINIRYLLFLDLDGDGIKETVINSNTSTLPIAQQPAAGTLQYNNASNPNFSGGTNRIFDQRLLPDAQKYRFAVETTVNGNRRIGRVRWNTQAAPSAYSNPQLPHGQHSIKWFVSDQCGNESACQYNFTVGNLPIQLTTISGNIRTELNAGVSAQVDINAILPDGTPYNYFALSNPTGYFIVQNQFAVGTAYSLKAEKNGNALNGVTTYDLILINQHILGVNALNSPYKIIAADANKSNSVTAFDVLELRKLILGIYEDTLPGNKSWRFVDKSFVFTNPVNPFQTPFPETVTVDSLVPNQSNDFVAIKIGDVNNTANPSQLATTNDRTTGSLWFETTDQTVQPGEIIDVNFRAAEAVAGYQFTLDYPGLELLNIKPGAAMQADNFAVFATQSALTTSFDGTEPKNKPEFTVQFRAREAGRLSELLHLSGRITPAEAYKAEDLMHPMDVKLSFGSNGAVSAGFELLPCTPNPFREKTSIGFRLPTATTATLRIFDIAGHIVYTRTAEYTAGLHEINVGKSDLGSTGVYFYQLQTTNDSAVQKMILGN